MPAIITYFLAAILVSLTHGASIVPVDTTYVKSDRIGNGFSYSIHENRGLLAAAVEPLPLHRVSFAGGQILQQPGAGQTAKQAAAPLPLQSLNYASPAFPFAYGHSLGYIPAGYPATQYAYSYPYAYPIAYNLVKA